MTLRVARYTCLMFCSSQYNQALHMLPFDLHRISRSRSACACCGVESFMYMLMQVLEWCPKNNLVRKVLGAIKVPSHYKPCCLKRCHSCSSRPCSQLESLRHKSTRCPAQAYTPWCGPLFSLPAKLSRAKLILFSCCLQSNQQPKKLKVYPAQVDDDGNISVKFFTAST